MTDADIHAFGPELHRSTTSNSPKVPAPGAARHARRWGWATWLLCGTLLVGTLLVAALAAAWMGALLGGSNDALHVVVNGHSLDLQNAADVGTGGATGVLLLVGATLLLAVVLTAVAMLFVVPLALGVALFGAAFALAAAVLSVAGAAALALSPLLLLGGLLWLAFRAGRRRSD
jgi:hypothetical protein